MQLINKQKIAENQYFPIFGFSTICEEIANVDQLKQRQEHNLTNYLQSKGHKNNHESIQAIKDDYSIAETYKYNAIMYALNNNQISLTDIEMHLKNLSVDLKKQSDYRRLLCLYDLKKYKS